MIKVCVRACMHACVRACMHACVHVCMVSVLAEAERVGQKCDGSAANRFSIWKVKNCVLLGYKSTHTCEP